MQPRAIEALFENLKNFGDEIASLITHNFHFLGETVTHIPAA